MGTGERSRSRQHPADRPRRACGAPRWARRLPTTGRPRGVCGRTRLLYRILAEITALPAELGPSLRSLEDAGLVRRHTPTEQPVYLFQHALTREVAYEALVRRERARLHRAVAHALERLFPAQLSEMPELLAHHWRLAGDVERAVSYLTRSGDRALDRYAINEAHQHYATAYDLLMTKPPSSQRDRMLALVLCDWMEIQHHAVRPRRCGPAARDGETLG